MITLEHIRKTYFLGHTEVPALLDIHLDIPLGAFISIAGRSGSGKSTLLNLLGCIDVPTSGTYLFDGQDVGQLSEQELTDLRRHHIGYIFQSFNLIPVLTAFENVAYPLLLEHKLKKSEIQARVLYYLKAVGLYDYRFHKPAALSGGQRQRVAIARALVKHPKMILADEPTANLDSATGEAVIELMCQLNQKEGVTFVFSTHDPQVLSYAKQAYFIKDGRFEQEGLSS